MSTRYFPVGRSAWISNGTTRKAFRQLVHDAAGVHIHGLWQMSTSLAAHTARASKKPYLISGLPTRLLSYPMALPCHRMLPANPS